MKARFPSYDERAPKDPREIVRSMTPDPPVTTLKELETGRSMVAADSVKSDEKLSDCGALADNQFFK